MCLLFSEFYDDKKKSFTHEYGKENECEMKVEKEKKIERIKSKIQSLVLLKKKKRNKKINESQYWR